MGVNILFIILTFIIIIAVILLAENLMTAMLIVSLLANFLVISAQFGKISKNILNISATGMPPKPSPKIEPPASSNVSSSGSPEQTEQDTNLYGPLYELWHEYNNAYSDCYNSPQMVVGSSCAERTYNIDEANAFMAQKRARDKKCMDGLVTRDASYYKYHYGDELDQAEERLWWGKFEH